MANGGCTSPNKAMQTDGRFAAAAAADGPRAPRKAEPHQARG